jgi:hypothetical protein
MVYWLILIGGFGSTAMMHVGNFNSMDSCMTAAKGAQIYQSERTGGAAAFYCVRANEAGTDAPRDK